MCHSLEGSPLDTTSHGPCSHYHSFMVWYAAERDKSSTLTLYSVMIFSLLSPGVCQILYDLALPISWSKSIIAESGSMEFAKERRGRGY